MERVIPARLVGLQGRLARPFWGLMGLCAAVCGAVASSQLRWVPSDLPLLALVLLLVELGWGSLWDQVVGVDWSELRTGRGPATQLPLFGDQLRRPLALPYTQPGSPGGRIFAGLDRFRRWFRTRFWPQAGPALLGSLAAVALMVVVSLLLPERLRILNVALLALVGLGAIRRWRGRAPLAPQAVVLVGLSWLAGHGSLAEVSRPSFILALAFTVAAWGALRAAQGQPRGLWLLNGGQVVAVALVAAQKQPLAAGLMGLFFFGQLATQLALSSAEGPIIRRTWPWLLAAMLVAAWAMP